MRVGILTSGGDCPRLNATIRSIVIQGEKEGYEMIGFIDGWAGVLENRWRKLTEGEVEDIHRQGGTILFTCRTNPYKETKGLERVKDTLKKNRIDALVAIGGDDTLGVAHRLCSEGIKIVGIPKTIDNDLSATDYSIGFDTAINIAVEAMDRLHSTARSHHRVMVVEIMGRHVGWMTLEAGIGGGAHIILIPEVPFDLDEVCRTLRERKDAGKNYSMVAVAEGAKAAKGSKLLTQEVVKEASTDAFGNILLGGVGEALAKEIVSRTGLETRSVILGHLQRGGSPSAFDRFLATRFGIKAVELIKEGKFGEMTSLKGTDIISVPLRDAVERTRYVSLDWYNRLVGLFWGK